MISETLTDEQRAFVEAIRDFAKRECGTREQRDALTDHGNDPHTGSPSSDGLGPRSPSSTAARVAAPSNCVSCARSSRAG